MAASMTDSALIAAMQQGLPPITGPLTHLSFQRCPRGTQPDAPTNADRARALRDVQPVATHNAHPWPHLQPKEEPCPQ